MSNIDIFKSSYVRTAMEEQESPLLDIVDNDDAYSFSLLTFHYTTQRSGPMGNVKEHNHRVYHIVLFTQGNNRFLLRGRKVLSQPGTLVITRPGENHDFSPLDQGETAYHEITFTFEGRKGIYKKSFSDLLGYYSGREYLSVPSPLLLDSHHLSWAGIIFETLKTELTDHQRKSWFKIKKTILELFDFMGEEILRKGSQIEKKEEDPLYLIKEYMGSNYMKNLSIPLLSDIAGMSPEHFCRRFKTLFHTSPMAYRRQLQISASETLLKNTAMLCKEIAFHLGFSDVYTFSKAFRKIKGMSPTAFRLG